MRAWTIRLLTVVWVLLQTPAFAQSGTERPNPQQPAGQPTQNPSDGEDAEQRVKIAQWVQDLSANQYYVRDEATRNLITAGSAAVDQVAIALSSNNLEVTTRGILILQELALSSDLKTEKVARQALQRVATARVTAAARRASVALAKLDQLRQQRALKELVKLGAKLRQDYQEVGVPIVGGLFAIEIGKGWTGTGKDLHRLRWLNDVEQVILEGKAVTDEWVQHVRDMKRLEIIKIRRANISDEALKSLKDLPRLQYVKLLYVPVGNGAIKHLSACHQISKLFVYGTRMNSTGVLKLKASGIDVDLRKGAFLGISVPRNTDEEDSWFIHEVTANSAAKRAGIIPGDVITRYDGKTVESFEELMAMIAGNDAGDTVLVEILRDGQKLDRQITFGEWE